MPEGDSFGGWTPAPGWQPGQPPPAAPATDSFSSPPSIINTSYADAPGAHNGYRGTEWGPPQDPAAQRIRAAVSEAYHHGGGGIITPEYRQQIEDQPGPGPFGWINRNIVLPALGVASAVPAAVGATVGELFNAASEPGTIGRRLTDASGGRPLSDLGRDINFGAPAVLADTAVTKAGSAGGTPVDTPQLRKFTEPVPPPEPTQPTYPSPRQIYEKAFPPDPVTDAAIELLRRNAPSSAMPPPPIPFKGAEPPPGGGLLDVKPPAPPPSGGLLGPRVPQPAMTTDEMLARSQLYYNPADQQVAQNARVNPAGADSVRKLWTDAVSRDPETAAVVGNTPIVQTANNLKSFMGQPMSFDTLMKLDRQLTGQIRAANATPGQADMARQLSTLQDALRDKMQSFGPSDTTGDPAALANLGPARQAYAQYIKGTHVDDLNYDASLLSPEKQDTYIRNRATSYLRSDKSNNLTPDERAAWEQVAKSGDVGWFARLMLPLAKPVGALIGGKIGSFFGPGAMYVGANVGSDLATQQAARLRAYLSQTNLEPVRAAISQNVPPIPPMPRP